MRPSDQREFVRLVSDALSYWKQDVSEFTLAVWWESCRPYTIEQVTRAMTTHAKDPSAGQFAPKVADVVRILDGTTTDRAALAWGMVIDAASSVGAYRDVVFDDPVIHAVVVDLGGWPKVCRSETDELGYVQKRFCDAYKAYASRPDFAYPRVLIGDRSPDDVYARAGLSLPTPALVGDASKARAVYRCGAVGSKTAVTFEKVADMMRITQ